MTPRYHRPATLDEALALRAAHDLEVLAGGTDVYPARTTRAGWGHVRNRPLLDLSRIPGLDRIEARDGGWHIGALATWRDVIAADLPPLFDGLKAAAREVGGVQIQARGTLVGNVCTASPAGDGIPCLLALDAQVEIASQRGVRTVALGDVFEGYRKTVLAPDEIVTALIIPDLAGGRGTFLKLGARAYLVISIAMVSAVIALNAAQRITTARIAVGACSAIPQRLLSLEAKLAEHPIASAADVVTSDDLAHLSPIDDVRASADYRRTAALQLVRDLLARYAEPARRAA